MTGPVCAARSSLTYLIVDIHDRNNGCVWSNGIPKLVQVYKPVALHGQVGHIPAPLLHVTAAVQHALVCTTEEWQSQMSSTGALHNELQKSTLPCFVFFPAAMT